MNSANVVGKYKNIPPVPEIFATSYSEIGTNKKNVRMEHSVGIVSCLRTAGVINNYGDCTDCTDTGQHEDSLGRKTEERKYCGEIFVCGIDTSTWFTIRFVTAAGVTNAIAS